jgi:nucleotide-binding universal stress UspA family protein
MASPCIPLKPLDLKSILVATDLTESADKALQHGIAIARHYHAVLYVAHVVSSIGFTISGPNAVQLATEASERAIDDLVTQLTKSGKLLGVDVRPIVLRGNIDEQIDSLARGYRVDLIVVGTRGRQGVARLFFGSIAQLISKCCCCPVLTVGPHAPGPWLDNPADSGRPLLFATAFNKASAKAMPYAVSLANDFKRQLLVLHVVPPHRTHFLRKDHPAQDDNESSAIEHMNALIPQDAALRCTAASLIESCDPADGILRAAKRVHAVTIIMGSHRDSFSDLAIRVPWSIANCVNREAMCPVLTVRG